MPKSKKQTKEEQQQQTQPQQQIQQSQQQQQQTQQTNTQDDKLEKILVEVINVYAKVEQLSAEVQKMRKMLYWHRKLTEDRHNSSYSKKTYKKGYKGSKT